MIFSEYKHPDYRGHLYVASALKHLLEAWAADPMLPRHEGGSAWQRLPPPVAPSSLLAQFSLCSRPTSTYSAASWYRWAQVSNHPAISPYLPTSMTFHDLP